MFSLPLYFAHKIHLLRELDLQALTLASIQVVLWKICIDLSPSSLCLLQGVPGSYQQACVLTALLLFLGLIFWRTKRRSRKTGRSCVWAWRAWCPRCWLTDQHQNENAFEVQRMVFPTVSCASYSKVTQDWCCWPTFIYITFIYIYTYIYIYIYIQRLYINVDQQICTIQHVSLNS